MISTNQKLCCPNSGSTTCEWFQKAASVSLNWSWEYLEDSRGESEDCWE